MPAIKELAVTGEKWSRVVQGRGQDYADGIANPRADWKTQTIAAAPAYAAGIQTSLSNKSWDKGVNRVGTQGWQAAAIAKGPARWQQGIGLATDKYTQGFAKYHAAIKSTQLPARGPAGSPQNYQRSQIMGDTLHKVKASGG